MGKSERNLIEQYFEWWLDDCIKYGFIESYSRESEEFKLFDPYKAGRLKHYKTKMPKLEEFNLLPGATYNFDYKIVWNKKAEFILYSPTDFLSEGLPTMLYPDTFFWAQETINGNYVSYTDVKPPAKAAQYQAITSYHTFPFVQKILLEKYGLFVQKVIPIPMKGSGLSTSLFPNTFTPSRYFFTDGGQQRRKIKFRILNMELFLKIRKKELDGWNKVMRKLEEEGAVQGDFFGGNV